MFFTPSRWLGALLILLGAPALGAPLLAIDVDPATPGIQSERDVLLGDMFTADVVIIGVDAAEPLSGFELDLGFDPSVLAAVSAIDGDFLLPPVFNLESVIDNVVGEVGFSSITLDSTGASGDGVLATLGFSVLAAGVSMLDLSEVLLSAPFGEPIEIGELTGATVRVEPQAGVPEPNAIAIFALGCVAMVAAARRRRRVRVGSRR